MLGVDIRRERCASLLRDICDGLDAPTSRLIANVGEQADRDFRDRRES
jgi:hypothetical protein